MALLHQMQAQYPFGHGELNEMSNARLSRKVQTGSIKMSNGVELPLFGLGTWLADSPEELELALKVALDAGYRYFDTAVQYNNEHIIGKVLEKYFQSGSLKRSDVFITSKLPFYGHRPEDAERHIERSLKRLRVDYIDLYLLHGPYPCKVDGKGDLLQDEDGKPIPDLIPHIDTWRAIGVSNFNQEQIHDLYNQAEIPPHNLQSKDEAELKGALEAAIDAGYRYIDTATLYQNEHIIGEFLEEKFNSGKLKRSDIFITSKLSLLDHSPEKTDKNIQESLKKLRIDYIDLYLIHGPWPFKNFAFGPGQQSEVDLVPHIDTWRVLEKYYKLGKLKSIGLSNFNQQQIQAVYDQAEIKPQNLQSKDEAELKGALEAAIDAGYRYIDTATLYQNEHIIGEFLEEKFNSGKLKRSDIFITSKLSILDHSPEKADKNIQESLKKLRTDYIDLYLIHGPCPFKNFAFGPGQQSEVDLVPHIDTWRVLEKYYKLGKLKSIGLSNFNQQQIQAVYDQAEIKPQNLQVDFFS
uniref:NADP-dependent oxidoreductase domain-containing protein n=1 Tax=Acrobeloides nanus TaxID=290746 RepID=A0A914E217_9BILA